MYPELPEFTLIDAIQKKGFKITNKKLIKKSIKLLNILIQSGVNLKEKQSNGKNVYETISWFKNGGMLNSIFKKYNIRGLLDMIMKGVDRNLNIIIKKHAKKDIEKIKQLAETFKISLKK